MSIRSRAVLALLLLVLCLPAFAANDCPGIKTFQANDVQTGETVTLTWSFEGGAPASQTLTGHDFAEPLAIPVGQTSFSYKPSMPGEKHAQLTAVTACGTVTAQVKYHVKQCNVVPPVLTLDQTSVKPGDVINASIDLQPGHTARWVVTNGTASATTGTVTQITAGAPGTLTVEVFVKRGESCEVKSSATVEVIQPCGIQEPTILTPQRAAANEIWFISVQNLPAGQTVRFEARGAQIMFSDALFAAVMAPPSGSFEVDVIVSDGTCTRRFTRGATITPCAPTAVVSAGSGNSCDNLKIVVDFTGTPPFYGNWNDGQGFFVWTNHYERQVTVGGTYYLTYFRDGICAGTATGSATVGPSIPTPTFTIDPAANGWWYGSNTCPGLPRTATLDIAIPTGVEVVWSITNGTILGGQGTATLQFAGNQPGPTNVNAVLRDANGCLSQSYTSPYFQTLGEPAGTVTVSPTTIKAGETAIVTTTRNAYVGGSNITSSLGDMIVYLDQDYQGNVRYEYRSSHGGGIATINYFMNNACGQTANASTTLTIENVAVGAKASVRAIGSSCVDYSAYAEFTGVAPFSGTWSDGTSFTTEYPYALMRPHASGTYTLTAFSDANGQGTITGSATFDFVKIPAPDFTFDVATACPGSTVTARLTSPLPAGVVAEWQVGGGEILSGQGTDTITIRVGQWTLLNTGVFLKGAACSIDQTNKTLSVEPPPQTPLFDLYGVEAGGSTSIFVHLDPNTATWGFENSLGDPMEIVDNPQPNVYVVRYTSTHGTGTTTIRVYGTTRCGQSFENSRTMQILAPRPGVTLTSVQGETCGAIITATFTGTPPFTATWSDNGQTFTTNESTHTRFVGQSGYYYLYNISDANRTDGWGPGIMVDAKQLPFASWQQDGQACAGKTVTFTATNVPAGYTMRWSVSDDFANPANASIIGGQGTNQVTVSTPQAGRFYISGWYESAEGCIGSGWGYAVDVQGPAGAPAITLPATTVKVGETLDFTVAFDGNGFTALNWESSNGDPIMNMGQTGYTFALRYVARTAGTTTIRAYATTLCGQNVEATATLEVIP